MDDLDPVSELEKELEEMGVHAPNPNVIPTVKVVEPLKPVSTPVAAPIAPIATPTAPTSAVPTSAAPTMPAPAPIAPAPTPEIAVPAPTPVEVPAPTPSPIYEPDPVVTPDPVPAIVIDPLPVEAPESIVPPVPTQSDVSTPAHHEAMGQMLTQVIQRGKDEVPHSPDPLVAKPSDLESWRIFRIMSEFVEGFEILRKYGLAATFFGTARKSFAPEVYEECTALAGKLAKSGFAVITGGSAGIMEAANKGAFEAGGASIGLNIRLDNSQGMNEYLTDSMTFDHFFVRKVMLAYASEVYIYFPGGFGTLDEFTEIVTLVQTGKIRRIPIVLYGKEYWEPFTKVFEERLLKEYGAISAEDLDLYRVVDSVDEAFDYIISATKA